jgi:energy-converting hydrogenase B subunit Q
VRSLAALVGAIASLPLGWCDRSLSLAGANAPLRGAGAGVGRDPLENAAADPPRDPPCYIREFMSAHAILATARDRPGLLYGLTKVLADHVANITYVDILAGNPLSDLYFEIDVADGRFDAIMHDMRSVPGVEAVEETPSFAKIYGKRIIVMGGGAQVGQVAMGAISEADRHNIRGERISIDTIPLVGEMELAAAVRATARLPRVKLLVLAGSIMGGEITKAVEEVRHEGLQVISLNMAGSVPDAADLVVTDPVQAGVMAVMAVADTAKFNLMRQLKRRY